MKKIFPIFLLLIIFGCSNAQKTVFSKEALASTLTDLEGNTISFYEILSKNKGKKIVIEVWASWCSDCIKAMPDFKKLQADNPDVAYVLISMDKTSEKWKAGIAKHQLNGQQFLAPDGMKGEFGKSVDLDWIPRYIIVDKTGNIAVYRAVETDFEKINSTLKALK